MSWLFSRALAAGFSAPPCLDCGLYAPSSATLTPPVFLSPDKTTAASRLSRFGMTCELLTAEHGAELLTWCLAGFPARISASPERARESTASAVDYGGRWRESSARFDLGTRSWKTHQCLWVEDLPESSVTLPRSGMTRRGILLEPMMSAPPTGANESGFSPRWPTPLAGDGAKGWNALDSAGRPCLAAAVHQWPTPTVNGNNNRKGCSAKSGDGLATAVRMFPTPLAHDGKQNASPGAMARRSPDLGAFVQMFRTPDTGAGGTSGLLKNGVKKRESGHSVQMRLMDQVGGKLNPTWVEWLMGWPLGWTDLGQSATDKCRSWRQSHSNGFGNGFAENNE